MRSKAPRFPDNGPVEAARNRLLRRIDWRFLLPDASPARVVCFAPLLADGMRATMPVVDDEVTVPGTYDLVVAQNPERPLSELAWSALRPGATYYSEWMTPRPRRLTHIRNELLAIGFEDVAFYWFWPWGASVRLRAWLPLESPAAWHYFFATRPRNPNRAARAVYALARAGWLMLLRTGLHPAAVVARRPRATEPGVVGAPDVGRFVRDAWSSWDFGSTPKRLHWLLLTGGPRSISKPVALVFANDECTPRLAVKFARVPEASAPIRNEATALQALPRRNGTVDGAPHVMFVDDRPHGAVVGETVLDGAPLSTALSWSNAEELTAASTRWLCELAGDGTAFDPAEWRERLVDSPSREFARMYGEVVSDRELEAAERCITTLPRLPLVCEHRDFSPWNVLVGRDRQLRVLDWESAEQRGLPLRDLTYFLAYVGFSLEGATKSRRFAETYRRMLDPQSRLGALIGRQMSTYCETLRIPRDAAHPLRLLTWMVHGFSEYRSLVADVGGRPSAERLSAGLFLTLWREELNAGARL